MKALSKYTPALLPAIFMGGLPLGLVGGGALVQFAHLPGGWSLAGCFVFGTALVARWALPRL